jgi:hypothetical protein
MLEITTKILDESKTYHIKIYIQLTAKISIFYSDLNFHFFSE